MTENRVNGLSLVANKASHIVFNADVTFNIEEQADVKSVHVSDAVYTLILDALKKQAEGAHLFPGDYRLSLTGCVSDVTATGVVNGNDELTGESTEEESENPVHSVEAGAAGEEAEEASEEEGTEAEGEDEEGAS
jgi:hypothetical protein